MSIKGRLTAPFPFPGGKGRQAELISRRIGKVGVYVEGFAGSLAVLLSREPADREVVCDLDGLIANFWRALQADPDAVAWHADWPSNNHDLTARHGWLLRWRRENAAKMSEDPDFYDAKAAGWWAWGKSVSIGKWCVGGRPTAGIPHVGDHPARTGQGVSVHRRGYGFVDGIPFLRDKMGGQGVTVQREVTDGRPFLGTHIGGQGVTVNRREVSPTGRRGERLRPWMHALAARLERVVVLNRGYQSAVTPTVLTDTPSGAKRTVGVLLDPPYLTARRTKTLYDGEENSDEAAVSSFLWAAKHGRKYRIVFCSADGDFPTPPGWTKHVNEFAGVRSSDRRGSYRDCLMFSPACRPDPQGGLFS